jgi:hypothetical protein
MLQFLIRLYQILDKSSIRACKSMFIQNSFWKKLQKDKLLKDSKYNFENG